MRIFVSGPYSAPTAEGRAANIERARQAVVALVHKGHVPICPHTMIGGCFGEISEDQAMGVCLALVPICEAMLSVGNWQDSSGSHRERDLALNLNLLIFDAMEDVPTTATPQPPNALSGAESGEGRGVTHKEIRASPRDYQHGCLACSVSDSALCHLCNSNRDSVGYGEPYDSYWTPKEEVKP